MPVEPNVLERLLLFRLDRGPAPMLDLFGAAGFEAVTLAIDLGVFEALADAEGRPIADVATRVDADREGLAALLGFLDALGYVAETGTGYRNTRMTTRWLTDDEGTNVAPWLTFWDELVLPFWEEELAEAVREGSPSRTLYEWFDEEPDRWRTAQRGFRAAASVLVDEVARKTTVPPGATELLDVGGGHGLYAIELCRRHPALSATVFDLPDALDVAREEITAAGLGDRIETRGGDYLTDDLGGGYDVVLAFNVVHAHDGPTNAALFERIADALAPGGRVAVLDQLAGTARTPVGRAGQEFVRLTYTATLGARTYPADEVAAWLRAAGLRNVERTAIRRAGPGNDLVEATKPGGG